MGKFRAWGIEVSDNAGIDSNGYIIRNEENKENELYFQNLKDAENAAKKHPHIRQIIIVDFEHPINSNGRYLGKIVKIINN